MEAILYSRFGTRNAFIVNGNDAKRNLNLNSDNDNWNANYEFVGVCDSHYSPPSASWRIGGVSFCGMLCIHFPSMFPIETSFWEICEY